MSTSQLVRRKTPQEFRSAARIAIRRSKSEPTLNSWDYMDEELVPKKKKKKRKKKRRKPGKLSGSDKERSSSAHDYSSSGTSPRFVDGKDMSMVQRSSTQVSRRFTDMQLREMQAREAQALDAQREYYSQLPPPSAKGYAALMAGTAPIAPLNLGNRRLDRDEVQESPRRMPTEEDFGNAEEEQDVCDIDDDEETDVAAPRTPKNSLKNSLIKRAQQDTPESAAAMLRRSMSLSHMLEATVRAKKPIEKDLETLEHELDELVELGVSFEEGQEDTTRKLIASGSVSSLIDILTSLGKQDNFFIHEFLSTHKYFVDTSELLRMVCTRYTASFASVHDSTTNSAIRSVNVIRKWIEFYILSLTDDDIAYLSNFIQSRVIPVQRQWGKLLQTLLKRQIREQRQHYINVDHFKGFEGCLQNEFTGDRCSLELLADFIVCKNRQKAVKRKDIVSEDVAIARIQRALSVSDERAHLILKRALVREHYFVRLSDKEVEALAAEKDWRDNDGPATVYYQYQGPRVHRHGEEHPKLMLSKRLLYTKPVDFMDIHPVELARQFTLFEQDMFCSIVPYRDLVRVSKGKSEPVRRFISWSNLLANWAAGEVVQTGNMKKRVAVLKRLIMVGDECWKLNNFSSAVSLFQGLQNPSVKRLKLTWKRLPRKEAKLEEDYVEQISVLHNFEKLRLAIASAMPPMIPYFALFLRDLSLIEINNDDYVKPDIVNFSKFRMLALQFQEIHALQQQRYMLQRSSSVTRWIMTGLVNLSAEKLEEYSKDCENPQDAINFAEGDRVAAYKNYASIRDRLKRRPA